MYLFFRVLILAVFILGLAFVNKSRVHVSFFGAVFADLPAWAVIIVSALLGFWLCRWYEAFRQFSLLEVIKVYAKKVSDLENALEKKQGGTDESKND